MGDWDIYNKMKNFYTQELYIFWNNNNNNNNRLYYLEFRACELRVYALSIKILRAKVFVRVVDQFKMFLGFGF